VDVDLDIVAGLGRQAAQQDQQRGWQQGYRFHRFSSG
jgi:hypothetical protein